MSLRSIEQFEASQRGGHQLRGITRPRHEQGRVLAASVLNESVRRLAFLYSNVAQRRAKPGDGPVLSRDAGHRRRAAGIPDTSVCHRFAGGGQAMRAALDGLSALHKASETSGTGWSAGVRRRAPHRNVPQSTPSARPWGGSVVLSNMIGGGGSRLSANSEARAARGRALLKSALAGWFTRH